MGKVRKERLQQMTVTSTSSVVIQQGVAKFFPSYDKRAYQEALEHGAENLTIC